MSNIDPSPNNSTVYPLDGYTATQLLLQQAASSFQAALDPAEIIGLVYSPTACCFVRLGTDQNADATFESQAGKIDLKPIFEARLFTAQAELRWLKTGSDGNGQAAIIAEPNAMSGAIQHFQHQPQAFQRAFTPLEQEYILWGKQALKQPESERWGCLSAGRIGRLPVPLAAPNEGKGSYMVLHSKEYLDCDDFGNVFVAQERLTRLEWKTEKEQEKANG